MYHESVLKMFKIFLEFTYAMVMMNFIVIY